MNFIKGVLIGITMMIPGLSGGSMAMVLNLYSKVLESISNIFKITNIIFCFKVGLGILLGIFIFSLFLYKFTLLPFFKYIVFVIILVNIYLLLKEFTKFKLTYLLLFVLGILIMYLLNTTVSFSVDLNFTSYLLIGFLLAVSLILPGLGATYILYTLDLYDKFNSSLLNIDLFFLLMISLSTFIFILITSRLINNILIKDKFIIYSLVIGFLVGGI